MRRIVICLFLGFCACKSYRPAPPPHPPGIYQGYDSALSVSDRFGEKMFGGCVNVIEDAGGLSFNGKQLKSVGQNEYSFEYSDSVDYGIGREHDIHLIRRRGIFKFTYNHLIVEYAVGEVGAVESQYRFNGWR